jgi:Na+-driven multidrug efflux pump
VRPASRGADISSPTAPLRRRGFRFGFDARRYRPDRRLIGSILRYGLLLTLQSLLCNVGYVAVSIQTNRLLPLDYITVLSVSLPLTGVMSAFSAACAVFVPANHAAGQQKRNLAFLRLAAAGCTGYGVLCFLAFALLGKWYYSRLFDSAAVIAYGTDYWRIYGLGLIFVAIIFVVRIFLESVGLARLALVAGALELCGNLLCAFWIIPRFGVVGRSLSYPLGWLLAAVYLLLLCLCLRKQLFEERGPTQ